MDDWEISYGTTDSPLQTDGHSCGVFAIMTAIYWIMKRRLPTASDWTQKNMPVLRLFIASNIISNSELPEYPRFLRDPNNSFIDLTQDDNESFNSYDIV